MSKSFKIDLTGQRFGRWTVLEFVPNEKNVSYWKCRCDCGNISDVEVSTLKRGISKSCGCLRSELESERMKIKNPAQIKHGGKGTRLYRIWKGMRQRCYNPNSNHYPSYGGRGITICKEWVNDFSALKEWALSSGYSDELSIDRIDNNKGYSPENCQWTGVKTQCRNRRSNVNIEYNGQQITLTEASEKTGINKYTLNGRYHRGDRGEELFRPVKTK